MFKDLIFDIHFEVTLKKYKVRSTLEVVQSAKVLVLMDTEERLM
jgi:hypothetical protein